MTLLVFIVAGFGLWQLLLRVVTPKLQGWLGPNEAAGLAIILTALSIFFLFRAVAMGVAGLFTDAIVASVEEDHYRDAYQRAVPVPTMMGIKMGLRSALRAIGWNLLALPIYIALLVTGIGTLALMIIINGIILSKDLEEMVAARHPNLPERPLPKSRRWALGLTSSVAFAIPIISLLAPVFSAALAVHLLHMPDRKEKPA